MQKGWMFPAISFTGQPGSYQSLINYILKKGVVR